MKPILLIDGDIVAYKFSAACEQTIDWGGGVVTVSANLDDAKANVDEHIASLLKELDTDEYMIALSDPVENFRKDVYPSYKSHRADIRPPTIRRALEAYLADKHAAKRKPRLEGDDVLGIVATNKKLYPNRDKIIVSDDKDMKTIPGKLYRMGCISNISDAEADRYHLLQTLTGDRTDGYPGCPNVGPVKAEKILDGNSAHEFGRWQAIVFAYELRDLTEADALTQARCARILRHEDYDYTRKEPILWKPI